MKVTTNRKPTYDDETGEFRFPLEGPGNPELVGKDLSQLEDALDLIENRSRENGHENR